MHTSRTGPRLIIVCGLPGAGKTTHAKVLADRLAAVRLCPDEWLNALAIDLYDADRRARVEALQWVLGQDLLRHGRTVIIEWGTWARAERDALRRGARALGAAVELHYLTAPLEALFARIQRRSQEDPPIVRADLARWCALFEAPTAEEMALFDAPTSADRAPDPD